MSESLAPFVARRGFSKIRKGVFGRWEGDCFWRISCTYRKVPGRDEGWIAIYVCVGFRSLAEFLGKFQADRFDESKFPCAMAANSGYLREPFKFHEWRVLPESDPSRLGAELVAELSDFGMRYFAAYGRIHDAVAAWRRGEVFNLGADADFYLAAELSCRGDVAAAREFIQDRVRFYAEAYQRTGNRSDKNLQDERAKFLVFLS